jgi:hypothetical protein
MSTPNINCILQAVIAVTNNQLSPQPQIANVDLGNPTIGATQIISETYLQAIAAGITIPLPNPTNFAIVQNLAASGLIRVVYTPSGQPQTFINLGPQGVFIYFDPSGTGTAVTQLIVGGIGSTLPCLVLVGG